MPKYKNPSIENYYLVKTVEGSFGIAYWNGDKFMDDPEQNGQLQFGIKREFIKSWYELPKD